MIIVVSNNWFYNNFSFKIKLRSTRFHTFHSCANRKLWASVLCTIDSNRKPEQTTTFDWSMRANTGCTGPLLHRRQFWSPIGMRSASNRVRELESSNRVDTIEMFRKYSHRLGMSSMWTKRNASQQMGNCFCWHGTPKCRHMAVDRRPVPRTSFSQVANQSRADTPNGVHSNRTNWRGRANHSRDQSQSFAFAALTEWTKWLTAAQRRKSPNECPSLYSPVASAWYAHELHSLRWAPTVFYTMNHLSLGWMVSVVI